MTHEPNPSGGLRPKIGSTCRTFLRSADSGSAAHCPECAAHLAFQSRMESQLRTASTPPAVLHSRDFVAGIFERLTDSREVGPVAAALRSAKVPDLAATLAPPALDSAVASAAWAVPTRPDPSAWAAVHRAILLDAQSVRPVHAYQRWMLGLAAAAAVAVGTVMLTQATTREPTIVFTDLDAAPGIDFTLLRHGVPR